MNNNLRKKLWRIIVTNKAKPGNLNDKEIEELKTNKKDLKIIKNKKDKMDEINENHNKVEMEYPIPNKEDRFNHCYYLYAYTYENSEDSKRWLDFKKHSDQYGFKRAVKCNAPQPFDAIDIAIRNKWISEQQVIRTLDLKAISVQVATITSIQKNKFQQISKEISQSQSSYNQLIKKKLKKINTILEDRKKMKPDIVDLHPGIVIWFVLVPCYRFIYLYMYMYI